ncbi:tetratricopeptide repeat protein [Aurantiacibacter sp. MUD61]|uniref:tetratricopeptide repeat protein n=1 Tax=Aurantiacibacter sp. MUD61 TaxID=3009083 RepID=UPI0022F0D641|nr:tetratricopeptide repeat protein [Aurantiacibacter sp. MUD61]
MLAWVALALVQTAAPDFEAVEPEYSEAALEHFEMRETMSEEAWIAAFEELGASGDASAISILGEIFTFGLEGVQQDAARGCDYFEQVGDVRGDSLHSLAACYYQGNGREQDYVRTRVIYERAINAGYVTSLCGLGTMLVRGQGGDVDAERGIALCRTAAMQGDADAQTDIGTFLLIGEGIERDPVAARLWLEEAGAQGQSNATYLLGQIYTRGDGVSADDERASHWFRRSHEAGRPDASWQLSLSLSRRGMVTEGEQTRINLPLISEAQGYARDAAQHHPDPEIRANAAEFAENLGRIIAEAGE